MIADPDICNVCGAHLVVDHFGPDGTEYMLCPKCDADPEFGACGHPLSPLADGTKICIQCENEIKNMAEGIREITSDLGTEMRDCAFLWDIGIRVDADMLMMFRLNRRLQECGGAK